MHTALFVFSIVIISEMMPVAEFSRRGLAGEGDRRWAGATPMRRQSNARRRASN